MRNLVTAAVVSAGLFLGSASAAQTPTGRSDTCYLRCQYQCYALYPGGGPAWTQCYIACGQTQCSGG